MGGTPGPRLGFFAPPWRGHDKDNGSKVEMSRPNFFIFIFLTRN